MSDVRDRMIVALDVPNAGEAARAVREIGDAATFYKVGLELFVADGPAALGMLKDAGKKVFLDLKLHDIPRTVEHAVKSCMRFGADLITLHAFGSRAMIEAAANAAAGTGTRLLAVTVLTSLNQDDMGLLGVRRPVADQAMALGRMAVEAGASGLVCSPLEAGALRAALGAGVELVTPGVRPAGAAVGDQKRVATPRDAIASGASRIVVGRPVMAAPDRRAAAQAIIAEISAAL